MFSGLGPGVPLYEFGRRRLDFEEVVAWARENLCKDDRIIWFLGVVQRAALLRLRNSGETLCPKMLRKINRKLRGFDAERVNADFDSDFAASWPHYRSLTNVYNCPHLLDYSFSFRQGNRFIPKPAALILSDYEEMEERLKKLVAGERFCSAGKPYLNFKDGWTWFMIEDGGSYQEAKAMKHCGNGIGTPDDVLLSLREPIQGGNVLFWKPHLTFILNNGILGEMKGCANAKPDKRFHSYVEGLLSRPEICRVQGGGYLPENNFSFADMEPALQRRTMEANPELEVDPFGNDGKILIEGTSRRWIQTSKPKFAPRTNDCFATASYWIAFQTPIRGSNGTTWVSQAWCGLEQGMLGELMLGREDVTRMLDSTTADLLLLPHLEEFLDDHDPMADHSNWGKVLASADFSKLMISKPGYFRNSSLKAVWDSTGFSEAYLSVLNERFGLGFRMAEDGIEIGRFDSLLGFAKETLDPQFERFVSRYNNDLLQAWREKSPFGVKWLQFRASEIQKKDESVSLVLTPDGALQFFQEMLKKPRCSTKRTAPTVFTYDSDTGAECALAGYRGFPYEIAYRFGLRKDFGMIN